MKYQEALGWALVHFLWQGVLVGLAASLVLHWSRRPEARYAVCCVALAVMALLPMGTMVIGLLAPSTQPAILLGAAPGLVLDLPDPDISIWKYAASWLEARLPDLTLAWLVGACLLLLRAAGGWWWARRLSQADRAPLPLEWRAQVERLRQHMGVKDRVDAFASVSAQVPHVFGWWRPVLVLPVCALANMTPELVEALIAHELAHVRRGDYLVNLLQTVVESLLFYHPVVWWLSARMRREREMCCDEAAVAACGDRLLYSTALLRLEESRLEFAMAATGTGLKERIGRVLGMEERKVGISPVWPVAALVLCGGMVWAQWNPPVPPPPPVAPTPPAATVAKPEPPPPPPSPLAGVPEQPPLPSPPPPPAPVIAGVAGGVVNGVIAGIPGGIAGGVDAAVQDETADDIRKQMAEVQEQIARLEEARARLQRALAQAGGEDAVTAQKAELEKMGAKLRAEAATESMRQDRKAKEEAVQQARLSDVERMNQKLEQERLTELARAEKFMAEQDRAATKAGPASATEEQARRTQFADRKFARPGVRGSQTDRGKFYIKYGAPDTINAQPDAEVWSYRKGLTIRFDGQGKLRSVEGEI